ncbi:hypothetical protein JQ628_01310 [Bradyrhizobium lablabi]|nr:hypothetical protein [Bradyrhizobium lablabi]
MLAIVSVPTTSAHAQATRTWVSGVGDDANPCSRTAPCKTFAGAISKTATGGEINCIDPGGFGAVTITKSIAIICEPFTAGVLVSGTNAIIVNAAAPAEVLLQGLDIEGLGTGINGVSIPSSSGAKVTIRKSAIRNFNGNGVNLTGAAGARVLIEDTYIASNTGGVNIAGAGGAVNTAILIRTTVDNNTNFATSVAAPSAITLNASTLAGSPAAISVTGSPTVASFGNNAIAGSGTITATVPLK